MIDGTKTAVIVGASSGIGEALARQLHEEGWSVCLLARRQERLASITADLKNCASAEYIDLCQSDCHQHFEAILCALGGIDLIIISAGVGYLNPQHDSPLDQETIAVNVRGFVAIAATAFRYFEERGRGHIAAITSVAALRGSADATSYAASKAFQSFYLDGLRDSARRKRLPIAITELQAGFVDTDMMKTGTPLPPIIRGLLVADPATAAHQMLQAIGRRRKHAYITKRYWLIARLLKMLPRP